MKKKLICMAAVGMGVLLLGGGMFMLGRKSVPNQMKHGAAASTVKSETVEKSSIQKKEAQNAEFDVSCTAGNTWESEGETYRQYDVTIKNISQEEKDNWKTEWTVPKEAKINQGWNAEYSCEDGVLTAKPVDYNKSIPAGGSINYGFILVTKEEFDPGEGEIRISADGKKAETKTTGSTTIEDTKEDSAEETEDSSDEISVAKNEKNPVKKHGRLTVKGTRIVDSHKKAYQLKGVSTHGIAWFPQYVNAKAFKTLRDKYHVNAIRLAMYTNPADGYSKSMHAKVQKGVDIATKLGMYVIIDWHILNDNNPNMHKKEAKAFFTKMAKAYKGRKNVIYEICNEPNGNVTWEQDIKPYAKTMVKTIRKQDKKGIIIVGTPTWSQDVDKVAESPLTGQKNIVYACHFYAATHTDFLRDKVKQAINKGLPVFISEYSICDASGNGNIDYASAKKWFALIKKYKISCFAWNLSNKAETSSLIKAGCTKTSGWKKSDLSKTGKWILKKYGTY